MKKRALLLFVALGMGSLLADDEYTFARSSHAADYKLWGQPSGGVRAGIYFHPLKTADVPDQVPVFFSTLLENKSPAPLYVFSQGGRHGYCHLKLIDSTGRKVTLREEPLQGDGNYTVVPAGGQLFGGAFVSAWELKAVGNVNLIARVDLYDRPSRTDSAVKTITVESAPFQLYPLGPTTTPLPDDPMMAQWKIEEAKLSDALAHAAGPNDRSEAAQALASFYLAYYDDYSGAEALLPQITDSVDNFDTRVMLVCHNPAYTDAQRTEELENLAAGCPPDRQHMLESLIGKYHYAATHPQK